MTTTMSPSDEVKQLVDRVLKLETDLKEAKKEESLSRQRTTQVQNDLASARKKLQEVINPIIAKDDPYGTQS